MKTSELTGAALDWAVAKCEGLHYAENVHLMDQYEPSTDWSQGGPIIEREKIMTQDSCAGGWIACQFDELLDTKFLCSGETPLIAAMRTYVTSKLGEQVEIPEGLK